MPSSTQFLIPESVESNRRVASATLVFLWLISSTSADFRRAVRRLISSSLTTLNGVSPARLHLSRNSLGRYNHRIEPILDAIRKHHHLARPALLETHRVNFIGDAENREQALRETRRLLAAVLRELPSVSFIDTATLGHAFREGDPCLLLTHTSARLHLWLRRLASINRLRKLAWLTGLAFPAALLYRLTRPPVAP